MLAGRPRLWVPGVTAMTFTTTTTQTFSLTSAKYVASKVAADLRYMRALYGKPYESEIETWIEELVLWRDIVKCCG